MPPNPRTRVQNKTTGVLTNFGTSDADVVNFVDASKSELKKSPVEGRSANHFEVAFTEFEFLLDFGQAYDTSGKALWHTRIIMIPSSAKTLMRMLQHMVEQYEVEIASIPERTT